MMIAASFHLLIQNLCWVCIFSCFSGIIT